MGKRNKNASYTEKQVKEGKEALRHQYHESMRDSAREILKEAEDSGDYDDFDDAYDAINDEIHTTADRSQWVIYTSQALDALTVSDNWRAIEDHGMGYPSDDFTRVITQAAYWAVYADISQYIQAFANDYWKDEEDDQARHRGPRRNPAPAPAPAPVPTVTKAKLLR